MEILCTMLNAGAGILQRSRSMLMFYYALSLISRPIFVQAVVL